MPTKLVSENQSSNMIKFLDQGNGVSSEYLLSKIMKCILSKVFSMLCLKLDKEINRQDSRLDFSLYWLIDSWERDIQILKLIFGFLGHKHLLRWLALRYKVYLNMTLLSHLRVLFILIYSRFIVSRIVNSCLIVITY